MGALGVMELAKTKKTNREPEPEPEKWARQPFAVQIRGRPEWKQWVKDLADSSRLDVSDLVDQALTKLAREAGFREPPPR